MSFDSYKRVCVYACVCACVSLCVCADVRAFVCVLCMCMVNMYVHAVCMCVWGSVFINTLFVR